jgi:hypothetical protein
MERLENSATKCYIAAGANRIDFFLVRFVVDVVALKVWTFLARGPIWEGIDYNVQRLRSSIVRSSVIWDRTPTRYKRRLTLISTMKWI